MKPEAGTLVQLAVDREVPPYGYFLAASPGDILLPYGEADGRFSPGDTVEVFLFHDAKGRLTATMRKPLALVGETALLEVADVHPSLGCFLDIGIGRDVLLPMSELPGHPAARPVKGDRVFAVLGHDKAGRLIARAAGEKELAPLVSPAPADWKNRTVEAIVYEPQKTATFVVCRNGDAAGFGVLGMIHASERTRDLRLGETVRVRVARVREDGRVNLSMFPLRKEGLDEDAERILAWLKERPNGAMPYSDETPPDIIRQKFQISKAAFKRAIGKLMKEGLVYQKGHWTHLADPVRTDGESGGLSSASPDARASRMETADGNAGKSVSGGFHARAKTRKETADKDADSSAAAGPRSGFDRMDHVARDGRRKDG